MEHPRNIEEQRRRAEFALRDEIGRNVGEGVVEIALRAAMRDHTFFTYHRCTLLDGVSQAALVAGRA